MKKYVEEDSILNFYSKFCRIWHSEKNSGKHTRRIKTIDELCRGGCVVSFDENLAIYSARILSIEQRIIEKSIEIITHDGEIVYVSPDQKVFVPYKWVQADQLSLMKNKKIIFFEPIDVIKFVCGIACILILTLLPWFKQNMLIGIISCLLMIMGAGLRLLRMNYDLY